MFSQLDAWNLEGKNKPNPVKPCCASSVSREDPGMSQWIQPERAAFQHYYTILQKKQIILIIYKRYMMILVFELPNTGISSAYLVQGKSFCFMLDSGAGWGRNYKTGHIRYHFQLTKKKPFLVVWWVWQYSVNTHTSSYLHKEKQNLFSLYQISIIFNNIEFKIYVFMWNIKMLSLFDAVSLLRYSIKHYNLMCSVCYKILFLLLCWWVCNNNVQKDTLSSTVIL